MEALLSLPVVVAVLVLLFNFSAAVIQKSRASVAVREVAFRHLIAAAGMKDEPRDVAYGRVWPGVKIDIARPGWANYTFTQSKNFEHGFKDGVTGQGPGGQNANDVESEEGGSGFGGFLNKMLAALGGQRDFEVRLRADYPFQGAISPWTNQPIIPSAEIKATLYIDSSPWTVHELPCGYVSILTKAIPLTGKFASWFGC